MFGVRRGRKAYSPSITEFAEATGTRIAYDSVGHGRDLLFLHAGIANRSMWDPQMEEFSSQFRCTALDIRGFGESEIGTGTFSRRDDTAAVMDSVGAASAALVGCSVGAGFALDFAIERPERVRKLVLVGITPAGFDHEDDAAMVEIGEAVDEAIASGDFETAGRLEARLWVDGPRRPQGSAPFWLTEKVVEWSIPINSIEDWGDSTQLDPHAMDRLAEVEVPTLVVVGADDAEVIKAGCRATAEGIPGAELVELRDTAHLPSLEVAPEFNAALSAFLDR